MHTIQLCGMTKALGDRYPGALVNAIQPLVVCRFINFAIIVFVFYLTLDA